MADAVTAMRGEPRSRRTFLRQTAVLAGSLAGTPAVLAAEQRRKPPEFAFVRTPEAVQLNFGQQPIARYQLQKPPSGGASAESACYFHPVVTPKGTTVTDVAPEDHRHHRGVFLGWVEVEGSRKGDFWGWGEPAPTANRKIVNRSIEAPPPVLGSARLRAVNDWQAEGTTLIREDLRAIIGFHSGATLMDLAIQVSAADADVKLARWAFGGFAIRTRKDGELTPIGPGGRMDRQPPRHTDPESNWPDAPWYGLHLKLADRKEATVAVVGRWNNPTTTWHVVAGIGLINPCITAPAAVTLRPEKPLVLRYRVVALDGPPNLPLLNELANGWYKANQPG